MNHREEETEPEDVKSNTSIDFYEQINYIIDRIDALERLYVTKADLARHVNSTRENGLSYPFEIVPCSDNNPNEPPMSLPYINDVFDILKMGDEILNQYLQFYEIKVDNDLEKREKMIKLCKAIGATNCTILMSEGLYKKVTVATSNMKSLKQKGVNHQNGSSPPNESLSSRQQEKKAYKSPETDNKQRMNRVSFADDDNAQRSLRANETKSIQYGRWRKPEHSDQ
ncbi:hypothetical protein O9G_004258 [Rozella allomycis CSF55]|uniref:Mug135-like C-terminal domain-containing protein n=1 Tax=Rozella allomycis (strain CSF55) TaxID=988480 RepID=A0A075ATJ2_ROZAC|nr:hypothetical protein O9G_004258 [Rozella allomycis CSF55]|eukprot:EPZ31867.1 hypothetical protein O9G_004258 [Rozella allomycis CSF55]